MIFYARQKGKFDIRDKSLLSYWKLDILRCNVTQLFKTIIDEYERLTCTKRSANDIIDCHLARREAFTRMFAAPPDARRVISFYRAERVSRKSRGYRYQL